MPFFVQKYLNKAQLVPNIDIFFFYQVFQLHEIEGVDFKYDNNDFKTRALKYLNTAVFDQKYPNKAFVVPNLDSFDFYAKFRN